MKDISIQKKKKKNIRKQIESQRLYTPRKNIQERASKKRALHWSSSIWIGKATWETTSSINYAIEVIVFE